MKILAIDSTEIASTAAITEDDRLLAQTSVIAGLNHSETLLPAIEKIMKSCGLSYDDIDLFACAAGPGSFTGVRIGAATLKGLAFGRNKLCLGVSAPEAMAFGFTGLCGIVCPAMDARRSQLYNAVFRVTGGEVERLTPDRVILASDLASELAAYREPIYFCGAGTSVIAAACEGNAFVQRTPELLKSQSGYGVALCALRHFRQGERGDDLSLAPTYLRPSSAERNRANG